MRRSLCCRLALPLALLPGAVASQAERRVAPRGKTPVTTTPTKPKMDPLDQPFAIDERGLLRPPFLPSGWRKADGTLTGPIHSPLEYGNFFQRPEFKTRDHDGRLYYTNHMAREFKGHKYNIAFVRWTPLNAKREMAQHIRPIPGYTVEGFETDGKVLEIQQYPPWPKKVPIKVQIYRWEGDQAGNGRFILKSTKNGEMPPW